MKFSITCTQLVLKIYNERVNEWVNYSNVGYFVYIKKITAMIDRNNYKIEFFFYHVTKNKSVLLRYIELQDKIIIY